MLEEQHRKTKIENKCILKSEFILLDLQLSSVYVFGKHYF